MIGLQPPLIAHDRFLVPPDLDLGLVAIQLSVEHRMRAQPIGPAFQEIGLAGFAHGMHRPTRGSLDGDYIHAVDRLGSDLIARRLALNIGFGFRKARAVPMA